MTDKAFWDLATKTELICGRGWIPALEFKCVECKTELSPFWKLVFKLDID